MRLTPAPRRLLAAALLLLPALSGCSDKRVAVTAPGIPTWTRLTDASVGEPLTPDWRGDSIAFSAYKDGVFRIVLMRSDGTGAVTYPADAVGHYDIAPRFVNESLVVFWSARAGNYDVWYRNLTDGSVRQLTTTTLREEYPAPRPGRPGLAYCEGTQSLKGRIVLIPDTAVVDTNGVFPEKQYLTPDTLQASEPDWDPTGTRVAFSAVGPEDTRHIWVATLGAGAPTLARLTTGPFKDFTPRWSPDGRRIAFTSNRTGRNGLWVVDPAGETAGLDLVCFDDAGATLSTLAWSPDGRSIVVSSSGRGGQALWVISDLGF